MKPIDPRSIDLTQPTLFLVPYSHLDDIWRWSYPVTIRDFLKNTLDENFASFAKYPHFCFNWSGASRYAMMKEYYPKRYEELKKWVAAGRWHPAGSSWVENDTVIPSTESLIRQLLMGRAYFQDEFGKESLEYMLPDCFGFPYSLPSVLNHCGIRGFSTQKLTWGSANGIPFNVGRWIGPDGESVIAALNCGEYSRPHRDIDPTHQETLDRLRDNEKICGLPIDYYYMGGGIATTMTAAVLPIKNRSRTWRSSLPPTVQSRWSLARPISCSEPSPMSKWPNSQPGTRICC